MTATIKITRKENSQEIDHEATFDGDQWTSDDDFTARFLNAYTGKWQLRGYYPDPVIGTALEVAETLKDSLQAELIRSDEIDYSDVPADAVF